MNSRWIGLLLLLAAVPFYLAGMAAGAILLLVVGGVLELAGWVRLLIRRER